VFIRSFQSPAYAVTIHLLKTNLMPKHILMSQLDSSHQVSRLNSFLHLSSTRITCKLPYPHTSPFSFDNPYHT